MIDQPRHPDTHSFDNAERIERQQQTNITIIVGNPPYNVGQINENDNNKNRVYPSLDQRIRTTYGKDSQAQLHTKLYDMYVRFFRWATDRLGDRDGIICFVSNNGFLNGIAFDGFRKHLAQHFTHIHHLDLGGNARKGGGGSVFGIKVGVGITILLRKRTPKQQPTEATIWYHAVDETPSGAAKLALLQRMQNYRPIQWETLQPDGRHTWLRHGLRDDFEMFIPMGTKTVKAGKDDSEATLFRIFSLGVATNRDEWVYDFNRERLAMKVRRFIENYNSEVFRASQQKPTPEQVDSFVNPDRSFLKWTDRLKVALLKGQTLAFNPQQVRRSLYRPFCRQFLYFDHLLNQRRFRHPHIFPNPATEEENRLIWLKVGSEWPMFALVTNVIPDLLPQGGSQCFPFYIYDKDGTNRQENITDWALTQFQAACGNHITKWNIFHYIYAILHHPRYRDRYAENLKRDLPRIPLPSGADAFSILAAHGKTLAHLHIHYEQAPKYSLEERATKGRESNSWRIEKMHLSKDRTQLIVNPSLTLDGIPPACFNYRMGIRSALEWVIDQYQVRTDKRSGIVNDPNRDDDHTYIVDLVRRVVTVSMETMRIVEEIASLEMGTEYTRTKHNHFHTCNDELRGNIT